MPNWNENELTITGPDVKAVLEAIRSDDIHDQDLRLLDFNRIIPYPQIYRDMDKRAEEYREKFADIENDDPERQQKLAALGAEYGVEPSTPWIQDGYNSGGYEWACDQWMTKWNACHIHLTTHADSSKPLHKKSKYAYCGTTHKTEAMIVLTCQQCGSPLPDAEPIQAFLEFDTAWSPPIPVIAKLACMFPDHTFELKYFEGGMGFSGHARWSGGDEEFHHQYEYSGPRGG
ncbi:MAG: hypothetical protein KPEEDBHJ_03381 [Anaerolineales bacterium]|nr:hypothetical protein [Anaerolineales bacterium]